MPLKRIPKPGIENLAALIGTAFSAMLLVLTIGIRTGTSVYFEAALIIAVLGFASSVALAKFLMRGR